MTQHTQIHETVKQRYGAIATGKQSSCCSPSASSCCGEAGSPQLYNSILLEELPVDVTNLSLG